MIPFFTPSYITNGRELLDGARKMLRYKRDLLTPKDLAQLEESIHDLEFSLKSRDREKIEKASEALNGRFEKVIPAPSHPEVRENCEVFLVAIVIALAIRTFFLQPFTIPTGSMQPTLNGIIVTKTGAPEPNLLVQALDLAWHGRSYFYVKSAEDDSVRNVRDVTRFFFFNYAQVECEKQTFTFPGSASAVITAFNLAPVYKDGMLEPRRIKAGEILAGYADTGDHVFVNKVSYNFRPPKRGDVFVFSTANIAGITTPDGNSQYYIKRLAGLPGDKLRIDPPKLFVNGQLAQGFAFDRVMAGTLAHPVEGYRGYSNNTENGVRGLYLNSPESTFSVEEKHYFALGDNSYNSADSRFWGTVPQDNLMGSALFVYWPFGKHWGFIK